MKDSSRKTITVFLAALSVGLCWLLFNICLFQEKTFDMQKYISKENLHDFTLENGTITSTSWDPWITLMFKDNRYVKTVDIDIENISEENVSAAVFSVGHSWICKTLSLKTGNNSLSFPFTWDCPSFIRLDLAEKEGVSIRVGNVTVNHHSSVLKTAVKEALILSSVLFLLYLLLMLIRKHIWIICKQVCTKTDAFSVMRRIAHYKTPFVAAFIQWFFTTIFQVDKLFFVYDATMDTVLYRSIKVLYLVFLLLSWSFVFFVYERYKANDPKYRRGVHIFLTYLVFAMILLLVLWPGTWAWDDLGVIEENLRFYNWAPWQHILTSVFQMIFLQVLPFPGGIILIQNIIISICVAFIVVKLENCFDLPKLKPDCLDILVKISPFVLPPVLIYQFSGYRLGLYVYLEISLLCILICTVYENRNWKYPYLVLTGMLCAVVSTWRTEGFFYIPVTCILVLICKNTLSVLKKILCVSIILLGFFMIRDVQNSASINNNYEVISTLGPMAELIKASEPIEDKENLDNIDKVLYLDTIYENPEANGEELYWGLGVTRNNYSKEDYSDYIKAFLKLSLKYPSIVVKERMTQFFCAMGIFGNVKQVTIVNAARQLFHETSSDTRAGIMQTIDWIANKPVFPKLREDTINFLGQQKADGAELITYRLIWNPLIPIIALVVGWVRLFCKKQWPLVWIGIAVLIRIPITLLTQPAPWFMYFMSSYLTGYVFIVYSLIYHYTKKRKENTHE